MPSRQQKLNELYAEGMKLYPRRALNAVRFTPTQEGKVWGLNGARRRRGTLRALAPATADAANRKFLEWVQSTFPALYDAAVKRLQNTGGAGGLTAVGQGTATTTSTSSPSVFDKIIGAIQTIAPEYLQAKAQKELLDVQLDRAKQGLPPLDMTQYAPTVRVGLDTQQIGTAFQSIPPVVLYGAGALLLALIVGPMLKRK